MSEQNQENNVFQTGSTKPPKSRQGLVALLLVLVVLLGGMVCALSMMNIHLFQMLEGSQAEEEEDNISFFRNTEEDCHIFSELKAGVELRQIGMVVQDLSGVYRQYQNLPEGLFVLDVSEGGPAHRANVRIGDILVAINGVTVDTAWLDQGSAVAHTPDQPVMITLMRNGQNITIPLDLGD